MRSLILASVLILSGCDTPPRTCANTVNGVECLPSNGQALCLWNNDGRIVIKECSK